MPLGYSMLGATYSENGWLIMGKVVIYIQGK